MRRSATEPIPAAAIRLRIARSREEAATLEPAWRAFAWSRIDADPDFFSAVVDVRPQVLRPHVVLAERDGQPVGMLVARVEDARLRCSIGYTTVLRPAVRSLVVVFGGVAGAEDPEVAAALFGELLHVLSDGEADVVTLAALPTDSALYRLATTELSARQRPRFVAPSVHRRLELPGSYAEFLAGRARKTRDSVKRYEKRFLREYGDAVSVRRYTEPHEIDDLFAATEQIAARTYQRGLGVDFADDAEHRRLTALAMQRGWFRAWVVSVGERPVAFWPGYAYDGTFFVGTPGYDPDFAVHRVGTFVLMRAIEDLCADPEVRWVDYGYGDSEYKRRFGSDSWTEADLLVFAPTARATAINAARSGVMAAEAVGRRALGGERADRVKKAWRARLAARDR